MALTALDIQQQRFRTKVRGIDPKEVQTFLEQAAAAFEDLQREHHRLTDEVRQLRGEIEEHRKREGTFKRALMHSQNVLDQMKANAEKQADLIVAEAMILANSTWGQWLSELGVPAIYRSQASLAPGVKVSQIQTLAPDIARALAVPGVRVRPAG